MILITRTKVMVLWNFTKNQSKNTRTLHRHYMNTTRKHTGMKACTELNKTITSQWTYTNSTTLELHTHTHQNTNSQTQTHWKFYFEQNYWSSATTPNLIEAVPHQIKRDKMQYMKVNQVISQQPIFSSKASISRWTQQ